MEKWIDLRSDTVTQPTQEMREQCTAHRLAMMYMATTRP